MKGKLIVLEGGEGSGKTSILERLRTTASERNLLLTREPGGSEFGEEVRSILFSEKGKTFSPLTQFHLFFAARADHVQKVILPALEKGTNVISDRFSASTFAHQIFGEGHHEMLPLFEKAQEALRERGIWPTYIYLDIEPKLGLARKVEASDGNFFDKKGLDYHTRVREGYRQFSRSNELVEIDASRSKEEVWNDFSAVLDKVLV
jgi:dTMP kinase